MVEFDTTFLTLIFVPTAKHPIADAKDRIDFLLADLNGRGDQIVVPTPALSEILVRSGKARNDIIKEFTKNPRWIIAPFDIRAALELSLFTDAAITKGDKRQGIVAAWTKVKFDRQIVAIGKVLRVSCIYSDDTGVQAVGRREGLQVFGIADIVLPAKDSGDFKLTSPSASPEARK
jgi:hypothetical protein